MTWPFGDPPNVAVFTSKEILENNRLIQYVSHDDDDGAWQFHSADGAPERESDARVVSLQRIVTLDPTVAGLADLPCGWCAWRESKDEQWQREPKT
jgi:hypothetical protein